MTRHVFGTLVLAAATLGTAHAQSSDVIRIGVLNDLSSVYSDYQGMGSVIAARMAVEDYGGKAAGKRVEIVFGDHQNKVDIGANIARNWVDTDGVSLIVDAPNSAVAFAVADIVRDRNKVFIGSGAGSALLTGERCSPNTVHWTYDTWSYGHGMARALMQGGAKSFYFITADYAFGHDLEKQATDEIVKSGGKVLGSARHPIGASDFSSFLLQAQASGAEVIAFANAGGDQTNSLKQAAEFRLGQKQKLAGLIFGINNIPALGLEASKGILLMNPFYWDMNEQTRAWSRRFQERHDKKNMPNDMQAGVYSSVIHYLKAVDKVGNASDGRAIVAAMKTIPTDDPLFGKGSIRVDGRKLHPMYLFQVKEPSESKAPWDYFKLAATIPAEQAFRPLAEGNCPLAKN
jgi:branched-chain amino acid transport system substrate-binding protein